MFKLMQELYPICRSITGNGVRQTLNILKKHIPLQISEIKSGTKAFDWTVPQEWNIRDAYIKNSRNEKIIDFQTSNLHLLNYSAPVHKKMSLAELKPHLYTLPEQPEVIPYLTTYYKKHWGFCLTHKQYELLEEDIYEVFIDSTLEPGSLSIGELFIQGQTTEEILFSCYTCHPSMCNDNLSGVVLLTFLAKRLLKAKLKYSYRFLFIPETIGAITWLSINKNKVQNIKAGLVATCVGDPGQSTYKRTRNGNNLIDKIVEKILIDSDQPYKILDFFPRGSDERQFCSPGFNLPVGSLMRTPYGKFPEYHTSADNLNFVTPEALEDSLKKYLDVIYILENNPTYLSLNPCCEPQLGKYGLYRTLGSQKDSAIFEEALCWVLNLADEKHNLLDVSFKSNLTFKDIKKAADALHKHKLLEQKNFEI